MRAFQNKTTHSSISGVYKLYEVIVCEDKGKDFKINCLWNRILNSLVSDFPVGCFYSGLCVSLN